MEIKENSKVRVLNLDDTGIYFTKELIGAEGVVLDVDLDDDLPYRVNFGMALGGNWYLGVDNVELVEEN